MSTDFWGTRPALEPLTSGVVLRVSPDGCEVLRAGRVLRAGYSGAFAPRSANLAPGHLVALQPGQHNTLVVWRWFDAVVINVEGTRAQVWEAQHGEVTARLRHPGLPLPVGGRAWVSTGLPGSEWWLESAVGVPPTAEVDLGEVTRFYDQHDLWDAGPEENQ